jgi:hypothetical protein
MKPIFFIVVITTLLGSCDPRSSKDLYQEGTFSFPVTIVNPRDTINLGDSVCFVFDIPDTISINGIKYNPNYGANDGVSITLNDCKMDTTLGGEWRAFSPDCDTYASVGNIISDFNLGIVNNRVKGRFYMIPKKKGVYFLWNQQAGYFSINNQSLKGRVLITFSVPDKHHNLLLNTVRPQNRLSFQAFLQDSEDKKLPIYGFAVK